MPAGITIANPRRSWADNVMTLSFKAKKGILGVDIRGTATVDDGIIILDVNIPSIVASFVDEETISQFLEVKARVLLNED